MNIDHYRIPGAASNSYYIPDFVTPEEEDYLLRKIIESPQPKWKNLANRRLQVWGGEVTTGHTLIPQPLPPFLVQYPDIISRLKGTGVFENSKHGAPNHVIVNEYLPGQGIMPHEDGPSYHPVVATISLGSSTVFNYYRYVSDGTETSMPGEETARARSIDPRPTLSVLLEPRSLVITTSSLYSNHLHGIEELEQDVLEPNSVANWELLSGDETKRVASEGGILERGTRVSLTCRDVERVAGSKLLRLGR